MIRDLKPYPAYKESSVPWLGAVPRHWEVRRQRNAVRMLVSNVDKLTIDGEQPVRLCNYIDVYKNERITGSIPFMWATATKEEIDRFRLRLGDVVITKDSESWNDIGVPALVEYAAPDLVCGYHLAILRPRKDILEGGYLLRALQSQGVTVQYHVSANGVTRYGLSQGSIKSILLPVPPTSEQPAITRFLDFADRRIRRYIGAKKKLITLLNEQKQAVIHSAVTRGLDPNVRLKPSGVEGLPDVPEHWAVVRIRGLVRRIDQGVSPQAEARLADDGAWGVLKAGCVNRGVFRDTEHKKLPDGFPVDDALAVQVGDVLVSRASGSPQLVGSVGRVEKIGYRLILSDKTFRLVIRDERLADFLVAAMATRYFRHQVERAISGAEGLASNLPLSALKDFRVAVPPADEAQNISSELRSELRTLNRTLDRADREISLIREYQTRLISDVVTGKLDVREVTAQLPDQAEELETGEDSGEVDGEPIEEADAPDIGEAAA